MPLDTIVKELDPRNDYARITPYVRDRTLQGVGRQLGWTVYGFGRSLVRGGTIGALVGLCVTPFTDEPLVATVAFNAALGATVDMVQYRLRYSAMILREMHR